MKRKIIKMICFCSVFLCLLCLFGRLVRPARMLDVAIENYHAAYEGTMDWNRIHWMLYLLVLHMHSAVYHQKTFLNHRALPVMYWRHPAKRSGSPIIT